MPLRYDSLDDVYPSPESSDSDTPPRVRITSPSTSARVEYWHYIVFLDCTELWEEIRDRRSSDTTRPLSPTLDRRIVVEPFVEYPQFPLRTWHEAPFSQIQDPRYPGILSTIRAYDPFHPEIEAEHPRLDLIYPDYDFDVRSRSIYLKNLYCIYSDFWWIRHPRWTADESFLCVQYPRRPVPDYYCIRWLLLPQEYLSAAVSADNSLRLCYALWKHDSNEWHEYRETFQNIEFIVLERLYSIEEEYEDAREYSNACFKQLVHDHPEPFSALCHVIYFDNSAPHLFTLKSVVSGTIESYSRPGLVCERDYNVFKREFFVRLGDPPSNLPGGDSEIVAADAAGGNGN